MRHRPGSRSPRWAVAAGLALARCAAAPGTARALAIVDMLPAFDGDCEPVACQVGIFAFQIPAGQTVVGATLDGSFGNANSANTAPVQVRFDNVLVAECQTDQSCTTSDVPLPWSYTFDAHELALLADGSGTLTALQQGGAMVRLGETTLRIQTVPEPSSVLLVAVGLLALAATRRQRPCRA